jgi:hypothetical protein
MTYRILEHRTKPKIDAHLVECLLEEIRLARHDCLRATEEEERALAENHLLNVTQVLNDVINSL